MHFLNFTKIQYYIVWTGRRQAPLSYKHSNTPTTWLERLTANAAVATVLGSIPAASDTVLSEGRQMKQC